MRRTVLLAIISLASNAAFAQGIGSFFSQQQSKVKIMLQQIADYEVALHELKNGYNTTQNGLNTVHALKNGTYNLHTNYFNSLSTVAPSIKSNPQIKGIADLEQQLESTFDAAISWQKDKALLSKDELQYMQLVYSHLLEDCAKLIDELSLVVTDGKTQMSDEARIREIDKLYADMQLKYRFARSFTDNAYVLAGDRQSGKDTTAVLKKLYDLN